MHPGGKPDAAKTEPRFDTVTKLMGDIFNMCAWPTSPADTSLPDDITSGNQRCQGPARPGTTFAPPTTILAGSADDSALD